MHKVLSIFPRPLTLKYHFRIWILVLVSDPVNGSLHDQTDGQVIDIERKIWVLFSIAKGFNKQVLPNSHAENTELSLRNKLPERFIELVLFITISSKPKLVIVISHLGFVEHYINMSEELSLQRVGSIDIVISVGIKEANASESEYRRLRARFVARMATFIYIEGALFACLSDWIA